MAYCEYNPFTSVYSWRNDDGSNYIPFSNESPDFYQVQGHSYYSQSALKRMKFTTKEIQAMTPDIELPNPRYPGKGNMKLYLVKQVKRHLEF